MSQIFFRRLLTNRCSAVSALQSIRFNSIEKTSYVQPKEIRDVNLLGTIYQKPFTLSNGCELLTIKTNHFNGKYQVHRALISNRNLLKIYGKNLMEGQRVYIRGQLNADSFQNSENKKRESLSIRVNEIYATKITNASETINHMDENSVCVLASIAGIYHFENYSNLNLFSSRIIKNNEEGDKKVTNFIRVLVHDANMIKLLQENLQVGDRVVVNGFLNSTSDVDINGKKKYSGHIEAINILKADRFTPAIHDDTPAEEIKILNE